MTGSGQGVLDKCDLAEKINFKMQALEALETGILKLDLKCWTASDSAQYQHANWNVRSLHPSVRRKIGT